MVTKPINFATEKILSVEDELIKYQAGTVASAVNSTATYIPCGIEKVLSVVVTPVKLGTTSDNLTAFASMFQIDDLVNLSTVSDLPSWQASTSYVVDQLVSNSGKAYQCLETHTSGSSFDPTKWKELKETNFVKITHAGAGAGKVAYISFVIVGY